jgi:predicted MPP superfamily phosphohydrolase
VGPARINQMKSTVEFESPSKELSPKRIAIIGDIQRTLTVERIIGREQNDDEREKILEDLISSNPDLILMLGDFVATCHDKSGWEYFDKITAKIKEKNIPTLGILGNHEYLGKAYFMDKNMPRLVGYFRLKKA